MDEINHIDEIGRQKGRPVAGIFFSVDEDKSLDSQLERIEGLRSEIVQWLNDRKVIWSPCFDFFDGDLDPYYKGDIFVDLEIDPENPTFAALQQLLETEDEQPKISGVNFNFYPYELCLENGPIYEAALESI